MARKGRRGLRPEERELWDRVVSGATPLARSSTLWTDTPTPTPKPTKTEAPDPAPAPTLSGLKPFRIGERPATAQGAQHAPSPARPLGMDAKTHGKMKRGKLAPEARIDLHGMTQAEAHPALLSFIIGAHAANHRLVLVITGKGKIKEQTGPIPPRKGVLRHHVPHWLTTGPLRPLVLEVTEAHLKHGGAGAFYVYLRRKR